MRRTEDARPDEAGAGEDTQDDRPYGAKASDRTTGELVVVVIALGLVAYLVAAMRSDAPVEIAEVIAATGALLVAAAEAVRTMRRR